MNWRDEVIGDGISPRRRLEWLNAFGDTIGCDPEEIDTVQQLERAIWLLEGDHAAPINGSYILMRWIEAAARSDNPELAAAAVAFLMAR
jgi:hypothetical protein